LKLAAQSVYQIQPISRPGHEGIVRKGAVDSGRVHPAFNWRGITGAEATGTQETKHVLKLNPKRRSRAGEKEKGSVVVTSPLVQKKKKM
jgi:hypothetical protein